MQRFLGKVCVLSASSTGIGLATAKRLAQEGGKVVISSRRQEHVDAAVLELKNAGLEVSGIVAHAERDSQLLVDFAVRTYGKIDCLMSNAAISKHIGPTMTTPDDVIARTMQVNVTASHQLIRAALPHFNPKASIVLLSSVAAFDPMPDIGFYCVSKAAMISLAQVLALELVKQGYRINVVAPGLIETRFSGKFQEKLDKIPMGRAGQPEEVAGVAAFLLSSDASFITGETIIVSGGQR